MYCPNCGIEIHQEGAFCARCRKDVAYLTRKQELPADKIEQATTELAERIAAEEAAPETASLEEDAVETLAAAEETVEIETAGEQATAEEPFPAGSLAEAVETAETVRESEEAIAEAALPEAVLPEAMVYCNYCGTAIYPEDNYCYNCGKKARKKYYKMSGNCRGEKKKWFGFGVVALLGGAAIGYTLFLKYMER